jgi:hypothetical protein
VLASLTHGQPQPADFPDLNRVVSSAEIPATGDVGAYRFGMTSRGRAKWAAVATALVAGVLAVDPSAHAIRPRTQAGPVPQPVAHAAVPPQQAQAAALSQLPLGGRWIYPDHFLVAYYGTAQTASMGVLGEDTPDRITTRLRAAAKPYAASGRKVQIVYELIVSIADPHPGADGNYSHNIPMEYVEQYVRAAQRNKALLVLDLQPGRTDFLTNAKQFRWALKHPWVGLALDPEWRMGPGEVPAQTIGQVRAAEINAVSRWLAILARNHNLPQKLFLIHQFRSDMVINIQNVVVRPRLATVQHVDGFGSQSQKLATYNRVARPDMFHMGFKLFYDEDIDMFTPGETMRIRPRLEFVSYQ